MRMPFLHTSARGWKTRSLERGSAVLIVLVLLACMVIMAASNISTLDSLKKDLKLIDREQQEKYGQGPGH